MKNQLPKTVQARAQGALRAVVRGEQRAQRSRSLARKDHAARVQRFLALASEIGLVRAYELLHAAAASKLARRPSA